MISRTITYSQVKKEIRESISKINTMLVGVISSVDYDRNRYDVQPILKEKNIKGEFIHRAMLIKCPLSFTKTKSFYLRAPYEIGDIVYVGCCKESIDEAIGDSNVVENNSEYDFLFREIDGVILGGIMVDDEPVMSSENTSDFIIQNRDNGDTIILQKSGGAKIKTSSQITLDTPVTNITGDVNITGNTSIIGNTTTQGTIVSASGITGKTVTNGNGIDIGTHTHKYVSPSGIKNTTVGE